MKAALLFNSDAGNAMPIERLRRDLARAGWRVVVEIENDAALDRAVTPGIEALIVAGGDGTVRRAALAVAGRQIPLAVLPLGTANNIAASLGIHGDPGQLIRGWSRRVALDLGLVRGAWGEDHFLEGVGTGLLPVGMAHHEDGKPTTKKEPPDQALRRSLLSHRKVLSRARPHTATLVVDGKRTDGEFLAIEVLNIGRVGPNLALSPGADPADGFLDVITAEESHRRDLMDYLSERLAGHPGSLTLPTRRARKVSGHGWQMVHVDDQRHARPGDVTMEIQAGALLFLVPDRTGAQVRAADG